VKPKTTDRQRGMQKPIQIIAEMACSHDGEDGVARRTIVATGAVA
jgi:sialic acid synthase SpsE